MKKSTKTTIQILTFLLINIIIALIYMRISPACSKYVIKSYPSIPKMLLLTISLPLYWFLGALVGALMIPRIIEYSFTYDGYFIRLLQQPICWIFALSLIFIFGLIAYLFYSERQKKINYNILYWIIIGISIILNALFLEAFFISMNA